MNIIVTYIEYVKDLEAIKTQKRIPWIETLWRVSFEGLNCAGDHNWFSIWIPINKFFSHILVPLGLGSSSFCTPVDPIQRISERRHQPVSHSCAPLVIVGVWWHLWIGTVRCTLGVSGPHSAISGKCWGRRGGSRLPPSSWGQNSVPQYDSPCVQWHLLNHTGEVPSAPRCTGSSLGRRRTRPGVESSSQRRAAGDVASGQLAWYYSRGILLTCPPNGRPRIKVRPGCFLRFRGSLDTVWLNCSLRVPSRGIGATSSLDFDFIGFNS